ncbi:uncharacterized protein EV154DRAFT_477671 [Mucor mucedo]|uniref:Uncharacterized protein n=1 Tax=Mucor saturninus TaxID=64648 RepID=A0A8H7QZF0_9FUNG|nr:uncharacterized protein EV154DRAFT_477671 [Mucor mucedo]KAG2201644.1 hypothetical protein INT47_003870 [Mucor saturninus]KAI7895230.1 hypothetical protein EV154DRAFT_477671 [Mucor mucedo]
MNRYVRLSLFTKSFNRQNLLRGKRAVRPFSMATTETIDMEGSMNKIEELFSAAKDELEYADESQGSVYYHEDRTTAEKAVTDVLKAYEDFLTELPSDDMRDVVKSKVGMKMRELKMTFDALPEEGH